MRKPDDTTKRTPADRLAEVGFFGGPVHDASDMIEAEERRGGMQMVESDVVPTNGSDELETLGIQLGDVCEDDPIFRQVTLPEGWTRAMGDNPYGYWTYLVDEHGRDRVAIFYKAAHYDRRAICHLVPVCAIDGCTEKPTQVHGPPNALIRTCDAHAEQVMLELLGKIT